MIINWETATAEDQLAFEEKLRRAVRLWCKFHKHGPQMLHERSKIARTTIWLFATKGQRIQAEKLQALCNVLAGWDMPPPPALSLKDFLAIPGRQRSTSRRTGIQVIHLTRASRGETYLTHTEKARLMKCYPGLITPSSIPDRPGKNPSAYKRPSLQELSVLEQMDNEHAIKARRESKRPQKKI